MDPAPPSTDPGRPDPARPDPARPDPARPESARPESARPDPGRGAGAGASSWHPGDDPGRRQFARVFVDAPLATEAGGLLGGPGTPITVAFETWGELSARRDNAILVLHALTGDSHAAGPVGPGHPTPGWWSGLIGPGAPIDTDRWFVVCPNVLGGCQGTTGPSSLAGDGRAFGSRFPTLTVRDQVQVEAALADELGIDMWAAVTGGSMGGMRALEWGVQAPDRVARLVVLACGAAASAEQIAWCGIQALAIENDPDFAGGDYYDLPGDGPVRGLGVARRLGHLTYRTSEELDRRFGREPQDGEAPLHGGRYAVESYLDHQAEKLVDRFDANSYLVLSRSMNHHDVGRGRGGAAAALARVSARSTVIGIDSDRLYPTSQQEQLARLLPGGAALHVVGSPFGHDGFLLETEQVGKIVAEALAS